MEPVSASQRPCEAISQPPRNSATFLKCYLFALSRWLGMGGSAERRHVRRKKDRLPVEAALNPGLAAKQAQPRYGDDSAPGITRHKARNGFDYRLPDGSLVRDLATVKRIHALAIPPAWADVWICRDPNGHLQATGRDQRGRKQYRYHPRWREVRDEAKYGKLLIFARVRPLIGHSVEEGLKSAGLPGDVVR